MKQEEYAEYRKTDYWKKVSRLVKERAKWRCQWCNSSLDLQAHHRSYQYLGEDLEHLDELIALCARCHSAIHGKIIVEEQKHTSEPPKKLTRAERRRLARKEAGVRPKKGKGQINVEEVDAIMAEFGDEIELTQKLVHRCQTVHGGFTNATLRALGVKAPLKAGWVFRLAGTKMPKAQYRLAVEGRYLYKTGHLEVE